MRRKTFIALVLAAVSIASANGSLASPAKARRNASPATSSLSKTSRKPAHAAGRANARKASRPHRHLAARAGAIPSPCIAPPGKLAPRKAPDTPAPQEPVAASAADPVPASEPLSQNAPRPLRKARLTIPPPLVGSHTSLVRQNTKVEAEGLERIEDSDDLQDRIARKMLVPVPASSKLTVSDTLPAELRYCRPWTAAFLTDLARAHAALYRRPVNVSSAVRTVEYQKRLITTNGNAAAAEGDIVSPHLTGATIDITKDGLSRQELGWLRRWLLAQQTAGKIDAEEEFRQACFHITVYKSYAPPKPLRVSTPSKPAQPKAMPIDRTPAPGTASQGF